MSIYARPARPQSAQRFGFSGVEASSAALSVLSSGGSGALGLHGVELLAQVGESRRQQAALAVLLRHLGVVVLVLVGAVGHAVAHRLGDRPTARRAATAGRRTRATAGTAS